jgi:flagellar basal body-associated protein FliL
MKILLIILGVLALAAIVLIIVVLFGMVRCAEAQEESLDDFKQATATPDIAPAHGKPKV